MDIAVCVKQVPVSNDVSVDPVTHSLVRESADSMLNPADANALEEAVALKEQYGGRVVVFTMGPPSAEKVLRTAFAAGADDGVLVTDRAFAGADTVATAKVLAESIKRHGAFDLVVAGSESSDGATGQVGPMLAEYLARPHLTEIRKIEAAENGRLHVLKKFKNELLRAAVTLPAVLTVSYGCNTPRLPTFLSQISANKKSVSACTNKELGLPPGGTGLAGSPTEVIDTFEAERKKNAERLSGTAEEIAEKIMNLLNEKKGVNEKKRGTDNG
jgi:electron transfer flavoprotein beta subunit